MNSVKTIKNQRTLDHFLMGETDILGPSEVCSILHNNLSPDANPIDRTTKEGTVVLRDNEPVLAGVKVDTFLDVLSPDSDKGSILFNITYKRGQNITHKYLYPARHIGNHKGNKVVTLTVHNPRQLRALAILSSGIGAIKKVYKNRWQVKSQHSDKYYEVAKRYGGSWACECPNWNEYHQDCKHIYAVHFSQQLRLEVERDLDMNNVLEVSEIVDCPSCKGHQIVKNGTRKCHKGTNQRYLCQSCGHRFVVDKTLSRLKATPEVISVSMDLYFKGNSLAKIKHHLKMFYQVEVTRQTVLNWIHKFSTILNDYAEKYKPEVGDLWNSDEMTVKLRETDGNNNNEWIWNLMDSSTRFLLASTITLNREIKDASKVLQQGKDRAGKKPKALITDGNQAYIDANKKVFYGRSDKTIHFRTPSQRKHFLNQNIERVNGTFRERTKVMRGMQRQETAQILMNGERFYYNFIRPHMSLAGLTPAQVANLPIPKGNSWEVLIRSAINSQNHLRIKRKNPL